VWICRKRLAIYSLNYWFCGLYIVVTSVEIVDRLVCVAVLRGVSLFDDVLTSSVGTKLYYHNF
jgi:hypothetical protein